MKNNKPQRKRKPQGAIRVTMNINTPAEGQKSIIGDKNNIRDAKNL